MNNEQKIDKVLELSIKNDTRCDGFEKSFDKLDKTFNDHTNRLITLENKDKKTLKQHAIDISKFTGAAIGLFTMWKMIPLIKGALWP